MQIALTSIPVIRRLEPREPRGTKRRLGFVPGGGGGGPPAGPKPKLPVFPESGPWPLVLPPVVGFPVA